MSIPRPTTTTNGKTTLKRWLLNADILGGWISSGKSHDEAITAKNLCLTERNFFLALRTEQYPILKLFEWGKLPMTVKTWLSHDYIEWVHQFDASIDFGDDNWLATYWIRQKWYYLQKNFVQELVFRSANLYHFAS